jgi:hypothetical protein
MKLCFMEGCDQPTQVTVQKMINTRGQLGDSGCEVQIPFCSIDHAAAFERLYPTLTEQMVVIISREEFEGLNQAKRMLAGTQRKLNGLRRDHAACSKSKDAKE